MQTGGKDVNQSRLSVVISVLVTAGLALSGCSGDGAGPDPGPVKPTATAPQLSGLLGVHTEQGDTVSMLTVRDPATGQARSAISLGIFVGRYPTRVPDALLGGELAYPVLSADHSLVAAESSDADGKPTIAVARYDGRQYAATGTWSAAGTFGDGVLVYRDPRFAADGRLWFERHKDAVPFGDKEENVWFSVDPRQSSQVPREEKGTPDDSDAQGRPVTSFTLPIDKVTGSGGNNEGDAVVRRSGTGDLVGATLTGRFSNPESFFPDFEYLCQQPITPAELLCWGTKDTWLGTAVGLSLSLDGKKAVMRKIFPAAASGTGNGRALLSPDRKTVMQSTSTGWFTGSVAGASEPTLAWEAPEDLWNPEVFAWV